MEMAEFIKHPTINISVTRDGKVWDNRLARELKCFYQSDRGAFVVVHSRERKKSKKPRYQIKILVWEVFVGPITRNKKIYHKNFDEQNCDLTNLVCMTKEEYVIHNIKALEKKGWRQHPTFTSYVCNDQGDIAHAISRQKINGSKSVDGYVNLNLSGNDKIFISGQSFVWEAFNGVYNRKTHQVDHINNVRDDNYLENLQLLTMEEHGKKTASTRKASTKGQRSVICVTTGQRFESVSRAAENFTPDNSKQAGKGIAKVLSAGRKAYKGYVWKYDHEENLDGEVWKTIDDDDIFDSIKVSNLGRIQLKTGKITYGPTGSGGDAISITNSKGGSRIFKVHSLICRAFHGKPFGTWALDRISVNHKDFNHKNNHADNLEWSNPDHQNNNKSNSRRVLGKLSNQIEWIEFQSQTAAAKHFQLNNGGVNRVCNGRQHEYQGHVFKFVEAPQMTLA